VVTSIGTCELGLMSLRTCASWKLGTYNVPAGGRMTCTNRGLGLCNTMHMMLKIHVHPVGSYQVLSAKECSEEGREKSS
jgi:hypothetical protein